tara:strand:- start:159786 stop:162086 length:2301 start_codon:yes stop_codon:yes gene_type:complete
VNISVFKDNQSVVEVNLGSEVLGNLNSDTTFFVGRSPECHVHLDDKQISREHAEISYNGSAWNIKQLSPFSKVIVNGTPYEAKELAAGDIITVGPYVLNVAIPQVEATEPAPVSEEIEEEIPADDIPDVEEIDDDIDDFDEETVAMASNEVDDLAEDLDEESFDADGEEDFEAAAEGDEDFSSDDFDSDGEDFEAEEMEVSEDGDDDLFGEGDSDGEEASGFEETDGDYAVDAFEDDDDDESTRVIQTFAKVEFELFGEYAPYEKYVLDTNEITIGRDPEKCQIVLNDPEVSGTHAKFKKNNITCSVEDLDSGNGTLLNGERINKSILTNNDEVIIGGTTFTVKIISDFLEEEENRLMPVEENQVVEVEEIVEVDADFDDEMMEAQEGASDGKTSIIADIKNFKNLPPERKKKIVIYGIVGIGLLSVLLSEDGEKKANAKKEKGRKSQRLEAEKPLNPKKKMLKKLSKEEQEFVESRYLLAKEQINVGKYREAITELDKIFAIIPEYKQSKQLYEVAKESFAKLEEEEKKRREEIARKQREAKVKILVGNAKEAVKNNQTIRAKSLFTEIISLDPENFDVPLLRQQIEAYERKLEREAMEKAQKEAERKRQVDLLAPGKNYFLNKEWHSAVLKLQDFVRKKGIDEDLMTEGAEMLSKSRENLSNIVQPLLGKARSLKEGQDLKGAYENYLQVLKFDPSSAEALDESNEIRERLKNRSKKIYREAIIAESLSLFEDAKEKFQEVQQVSPSDSEYYKKATEKLKDYLD